MGVFLLGLLGSFTQAFWGVLLYYGLAVLRPQFIWDWSLPSDIRWSLYAACIVILGCALHAPRLLRTARLNVVSLMLVAYAILIFISCLSANDPKQAMPWAIEYGKIFFIAVLASLAIDRLEHLRALGAVVLLCLGYLAWEINWLYVVNGRLDIYHRGYGGLDNNGAALMLAMGLPLACAAAFAAPRLWQRAAGGFIGLLLVHAVLMTYSRGAMLASLVGVGWTVVRGRSWKQAAMVVLVLGAALPVLAGSEIRDRFLSSLAYTQDASAHSRFESWGAAWTMAWEHPLLGQGVRNSNLLSQNYGADVQGRTIHNQYLQIAADSGVPAALLYVAMLGVALVWLSRARGMCRDWLAQPTPASDLDGAGQPSRPLIEQISALTLACESSLVIFASGGMLLSLEVVELPWLLLIMAGTAPGLVERAIAATDEEPAISPAASNPVADPPERKNPLPVKTPRLTPEMAPGLAPSVRRLRDTLHSVPPAPNPSL